MESGDSWAAAALFRLCAGTGVDSERAVSKSSQGANPPQSAADEPVPAYHAQAPQGALPATMNPEFFPDPVVQNAYRDRPRRSRRRCTSSPAIAIATAARDTAACSIASPANTARDATSASMRISTATSNPGKARPPRRFGPASSKADWQSVDITKYQQPLPAK